MMDKMNNNTDSTDSTDSKYKPIDEQVIEAIEGYSPQYPEKLKRQQEYYERLRNKGLIKPQKYDIQGLKLTG